MSTTRPARPKGGVHERQRVRKIELEGGGGGGGRLAGWLGGGAKVRGGELQGEDGMKRKKGLWKKQKKKDSLGNREAKRRTGQ